MLWQYMCKTMLHHCITHCCCFFRFLSCDLDMIGSAPVRDAGMLSPVCVASRVSATAACASLDMLAYTTRLPERVVIANRGAAASRRMAARCRKVATLALLARPMNTCAQQALSLMFHGDDTVAAV